MFKVSSLGTNTRREPWAPLINSLVDHALLHVGSDGDQTLLQFVDIMCVCGLEDAVLHQPRYLVVDWIQVWESGGQGSGPMKSFPCVAAESCRMQGHCLAGIQSNATDCRYRNICCVSRVSQVIGTFNLHSGFHEEQIGAPQLKQLH